MTNPHLQNVQPPPGWGIFKEFDGILDLIRLYSKYPNLKNLPRGNGQPILVLPGFANGDISLLPLRNFLTQIGYEALPWNLGINKGNVPELLEKLSIKLMKLAETKKRKILIIGWSLGGLLARELARGMPECTQAVITLGTPVFGGPKYTIFGESFVKSQEELQAIMKTINDRYDEPIKVKIISFYSKSDNIVSWEACIDHLSPTIEHREVNKTHLGMIFDANIFFEIAECIPNLYAD
jgi:esterase/lipase